jgi:hypothetical protein
VILALPASGAQALCVGANKKNVSTDFLGRVRYGGGIAVVLHCRVRNWRPLAYLVSTQGPFNTFIFYPLNSVSDEVVVVGYLVAERAAACESMSDADLARTMVGALQALDIGDFPAESCSLLEARHWPEVGPIVDEAAYRGFSATWLHPLPGVVLAGDYTWWDRQELPYGMWAAVASGRRAARLCRDPEVVPAPEVLPVTVDFGRMPLADTTVLRLTDRGPEYLETLSDGTIAYYGLLLQAEELEKSKFPELETVNQELERYLLAEAEDDLWGYQQGYGVTSLDSALVMEGLFSTGRHEERLRQSCRQLVKLFFDPHEGGFRTVTTNSTGRAPYWRGVDCPATAACAWLLLRVDSQSYADEIDRCRDYLLREQRTGGGWPGKWFPSQSIPIWYALRFFAALEGTRRETPRLCAAVRRAAVRLRSGQGRDGSWDGSVIETAAALLALKAAKDESTSLEQGRRWLREQSSRKQSGAGEPILSYWFEEDGQRTFFFTRDRGRVSAAWATLALADIQEGTRP